MIDDKALRSILESPEPREDGSLYSDAQFGYVILIDRRVSEGMITKKGVKGEPNYYGYFHLDISGLFPFVWRTIFVSWRA